MEKSPRAEPGVLHIDRPDLGALLVVEHRQVHGAGHVVLGELGGAAHIDDCVEAPKARRIDGGGDLDISHGSAGSEASSRCYIS